MKNKPFVSIIIPCRNEEKFIEKCLDSIVNQDYNGKIEILVVDGISEDCTRAIVRGYAEKYKCIILLDNNKKITPTALNIGIKKAKAKIIMIVGAHCFLGKNYIQKCVDALEIYDADNVGGILKILPREKTLIGKNIAFALSSKFGAGNASYKLNPKKLKLVDTVPFGCYKKQVFEKIGYFNENLKRTQDMEFNLRLKKSGRKIILVPDIVSYYYSRSGFGDFLKHNFLNGIWAVLPFKFSVHIPVSFRHLIPLFFVSGLISLAILQIFFPVFLLPLLLISLLYLSLNIYYSANVSIREKNLLYLFIMPFIFLSLHLSYGFGSLAGLVRLIR